MKIRELIEKLEKMDPELEVLKLTDDYDLEGIATIEEMEDPENWPEDWNLPKKWVASE